MEESKKFNLNGVTGNFFVKSVYDGDTVTVIVPIKMHIYNMNADLSVDNESDSNKDNLITFNEISVRLMGIDTPEMKPSKNLPDRENHIIRAKDAKLFLSDLILNKIIKVEFLQNDKYGRPLVKLYADSQCVNDLMISNNYAVKYIGGKKEN